ncbi:MAG: peptidase M48 [Bacteroides sp. SM1_62]|nr:MAG: peptidase M48 [Bacteroides sp. SM23_62]KPL25740.1 MAG: peptidase M48 [Bacteroides sp. SM1_62]
MNPETLFTIIVAIVIFNYIFSRILEYLNSTRYGAPIPAELDDVYDKEKYKKSMAYKKVNYRFAILTGTFSLAVILLMLFYSGFAFADNLVRNITQHPILVALLFFGLLMLASDMINIPFAVYDTFVIEERFGFNKTTVKTFITDRIKSWMLGAIIGGGILAAIIWFYTLTGKNFWIFAWILISIYTIFMYMFYSILIVPLFNKQTPLEEGELRDTITEFSNKAGFKLKNIFVIDGSRRSTKANAYFTGLGAKKRIVLYDTLINDLKTDEIVGVLAHEIGHYKKKHTLTGVILSIIQTGVILFILSLFVGSPVLSAALDASVPSFHIGLIAFGILYSPLSLVLGIGMNIMSRKNEYQADRYASDMYRPQPLVDALKKLSRKNLSNLTPHPVYVFFHYSHPPLYQRVKALLGIKSN